MKMPCFIVSDKRYGTLILLAFFALIGKEPIMQTYDDLTTPQPWFEVSFKVPDHAAGSDPMVEYRQTVNRSVHGQWTATIFRHSLDGSLSYSCTGGGRGFYHEDSGGTSEMKLSAFVGQKCTPPPGEYRICTHYELQDQRGTERSFGPFCSLFKVFTGS